MTTYTYQLLWIMGASFLGILSPRCFFILVNLMSILVGLRLQGWI